MREKSADQTKAPPNMVSAAEKEAIHLFRALAKTHKRIHPLTIQTIDEDTHHEDECNRWTTSLHVPPAKCKTDYPEDTNRPKQNDDTRKITNA
jgi:hypothetical protein